MEGEGRRRRNSRTKVETSETEARNLMALDLVYEFVWMESKKAESIELLSSPRKGAKGRWWGGGNSWTVESSSTLARCRFLPSNTLLPPPSAFPAVVLCSLGPSDYIDRPKQLVDSSTRPDQLLSPLLLFDFHLIARRPLSVLSACLQRCK